MTDASTSGQPRFSVLIAAYQAAAFVGDAVRSVLDQDPRPWEVIVSDDGSTDDLAGALEPFGLRVQLVRIEHSGEAAAKNAAAAAATGDWLAFLDADDRYLPGRLAAMAEVIQDDPDVDIVTTDALLVHDGTVVGRCYSEAHPFADTEQRAAILDRNFVFGNVAVRREQFEAHGGFDPAVAYTTDWDLWIRMILAGSRVAGIPHALAEYRLHENSMSSKRAAMARGRLQTLARAAAQPGLTADDRAVLDRSRRRETAVLEREELKLELTLLHPKLARRAAWRVARNRDQLRMTRLKALGAFVAPRRAGRILEDEEARVFRTVGGRRLSRRLEGDSRAGPS